MPRHTSAPTGGLRQGSNGGNNNCNSRSEQWPHQL
jgi:hypothetical protein